MCEDNSLRFDGWVWYSITVENPELEQELEPRDRGEKFSA